MNRSRRRVLAGLGALSLSGCRQLGTEHVPPRLPRSTHVLVPSVLHGTLARGPEVRLIEDHGLPLVAMAVAVRVGHRDDPVGHEGLARLTGSLLLEGVDGRDGAALLDRYGDLGTTPQVLVESSLLGLRCTVHVDDGAAALRLMVENLRNATLGDESFERLAREQRGRVSAARDNPSYVAGLGVLLASVGCEPPTAVLSGGTPSSIATLRLDDVRTWWTPRLRPESLVVMIAGAVHSDDASSWVDLATRSWSSPAGPSPSAFVREAAAVVPRMVSVLVPWPSLSQTLVAIGGSRAPYGDPHEPAEALAASMVAGGMHYELRTRHRTSYGVTGGTWDTKLGSVHYIDAAIEPADTEQALKSLLLRLQQFHNDPALIEHGLDGVRRGLSMRLMRDHHGPDAALGQLVRAAAMGLPPDATERWLARLQALEPGDVMAAMQRLYARRSLRVGIVGTPAVLVAARKVLRGSDALERRPVDLVGLDETKAPVEAE